MLFEIFNDKKKGRGYIATENIPPQTLILAEKPFYCPNRTGFITKYLYLEMIHDLHENPIFLQLAPESLTDHDRSIATCDGESLKKIVDSRHELKAIAHLKPEQLLLYYEKCVRNAFGFNIDRNYVLYSPALLQQGTLFNHSCQSNVKYFQVDDKMHFVTKQEIKKAEELTISYYNSYGRRRHDFVCECPSCFREKILSFLRNISFGLIGLWMITIFLRIIWESIAKWGEPNLPT